VRENGYERGGLTLLDFLLGFLVNRNMRFLHNLYNGRLHRTNYLLGVMSSLVILILFLFLIFPLISPLPDLQVAFIIVILFDLLLLFVASLNARRLHDFNRSGWWQALVLVFPPLSLIFMFCFLLVKGTNGKNKHGAKPDKKIRYPHDILGFSSKQ
jgi:uncharacterized membrane protein YhaH (DUF805 family)